MPATRRKLNTTHRLRVAAASPETETSNDTPVTATGTTDVAPATSVDAADNARKADHAEGAEGDGKEGDGKEE